MRGRSFGHNESESNAPDPWRGLAAAVIMRTVSDCRKFGAGGAGLEAMSWLQAGGHGLLDVFGLALDDVLPVIEAPRNLNKATYGRYARPPEPPP